MCSPHPSLDRQLQTETDLCLDPSPAVARLANVIEYNKRKYQVLHKRRKLACVADDDDLMVSSSARDGRRTGGDMSSTVTDQERLMAMTIGKLKRPDEAPSR